MTVPLNVGTIDERVETRHEARGFDESHFREMGFSGKLISGMPVLEAYQLMNKWNAAQTRQILTPGTIRYTYHI